MKRVKSTKSGCWRTVPVSDELVSLLKKVCGWKDLETMQRYVRLAGIETDGVTQALKILPVEEVAAQVVNLFAPRT